MIVSRLLFLFKLTGSHADMLLENFREMPVRMITDALADFMDFISFQQQLFSQVHAQPGQKFDIALPISSLNSELK